MIQLHIFTIHGKIIPVRLHIGQVYIGTVPEVVPDPEQIGDTFTVCVMNYEPKTDRSIYSNQEEITGPLLGETGGVYFRSGDCFIGVFTETAELTAVLDALRKIE